MITPIFLSECESQLNNHVVWQGWGIWRKKLANMIWTKERDLTTTFYRRRKEIPLKALTKITFRNSSISRIISVDDKGRRTLYLHYTYIYCQLTISRQLPWIPSTAMTEITSRNSKNEFHWQQWQRSLPGIPRVISEDEYYLRLAFSTAI